VIDGGYLMLKAKYIAALAVTTFFLNTVHAKTDFNNVIKGNYAFTGVYYCLNAPGGFNESGQPVNPLNSTLVNITISGNMSFDKQGQSTQEGNYVETILPASAANINAIPSVDSGTFTVAPSAYTVTDSRHVTIIPGETTATGNIGPNVAFKGIFKLTDGKLTGQLGSNRSVVLTSPAQVVQTGDIYLNGVLVASFPRMCSVTMTLIPLH